jgi:hypothetical protein
LEGSRYTQAGYAIGRQAIEEPALDADLTCVWPIETRQAVEQRGLAGAVGSNECDDTSRFNGKTDAIDGNDALEAFYNVLGREQGCHQLSTGA